MAISKTFNNTTYSIPTLRGENGYENTLSQYLQALADNAATTTFNKQAVRKATATPVTVSASTDCTIIVDLAVAGATTVNLPPGADKQIFVIVDGKGDASTNNITIDANGSETVEGSLTKVIRLNRECLVLQYSSSAGDWKVIGGYVPNMVGGPASSTDNAITRFDGTTGKLVQNSDATIDDNGRLSLTDTAGNGHILSAAGTSAQVVIGRKTASQGFGFIGADSTDAFKLYSGGTGSDTPALGSLITAISHTGDIKINYSSGALGRINYQAASGDKVFLLQTITSTNNYGIGVDSSNLVTFGSVSGADTWNVKAIQYASSGAVTLGNTSFGSATQQTIYGYGTGGANALVIRNVATTSGGDVIDIQTAATSGSVSAFTMTDGAGTLCGYCTIDTTANTVSYTNTSDGRLKHLFEDFNGLGLIAQMKPWQYERKVQEGKKEIGFVAQEMASVFPQAVTTATDEFQTMGIDYSKFTPILVKAIQEQQSIIDGLKARIEALESGN